jgi:mono/diheme cytochrome c family protein
MRTVLVGIVMTALVAVCLLGWRGMVSDRRPLYLVPDMDWQPRYEAQDSSPFFADGRTMRTPPAGTVAFAGGGYSGGGERPEGRAIYGSYSADAGSPRQNPDYLARDDAYYRGKQGKGWVKTIPVPVDMALLRRGQERFNIYCAACHGASGSGDGITTKYKMANVANYHDDRLRKVEDGYLFDVITNGHGTMKPYGPQVKVADRWAIVAYVRALQRSQNAGVADVPEVHRKEMK